MTKSWMLLALLFTVCAWAVRQETFLNAYVSGYTLDKQSVAGFDEKDIPFLENLVEKCIEDRVANVKCIHKGLQGRWKFSWRSKMWSVGSHDSEVSESIKDVEFNKSAMRAHFKDTGPKKMDVFITADFKQYQLDKQTLAGFDEKDIPFLENLVEKCIEDRVANVKCIHKGLQGRWKFSWRNKMWSVGSHDSEVSESIKDVEFNKSAMRAHFKDTGPKKMDLFITADFKQYQLDKQTLAGFDEKDIPFLENLVEKCIEDRVANRKCIHKGLWGRSSWRNKMWSVGSHDSEVSEWIKDVEFNKSAMRAHFKDTGPKKKDVFITSD